MNKALKISWSLVGMLFISILLLYFYGANTSQPSQEKVDISSFIATLETESEALFTEFDSIQFGNPSAQKAAQLKKKKWYLLKYKNDQLIYWNSNKVNIDSSVLNATNFPLLYTFGDDVYSVFKNNANSYFLFRLANDGKLHKRLEQSNSSFKHKLLITPDPSNTNHSSEIILQAQPKSHDLILILANWACFILLLIILTYIREKKGPVLLPILILSMIQGIVFLQLQIRLENHYFLSDCGFEDLPPNTILYLLNFHLMSLLAAGLVVFYALHERNKMVSVFIGLLILLFYSDFIISLSQQLTLHSQISFDFEKLFTLNIHSFLALGLICFGFLILWIFSYFSKIAKIKISNSTWMGLALGLIVFLGFQCWDTNRSFPSLLVPTGLVFLAFAVIRYSKTEKNAIYNLFIITAAVVASIVYQSQQTREAIYFQNFANAQIENEDTRAEQIIKSFENELAEEFLIPENYQNFRSKRDQIENRIKHLYFSNYLEKYELSLFSFGAHGEELSQNSSYNFEQLDSVYNLHSKRTSSAYFYQITNPEKLNGYIAKYENCDIDGHFGTTYILLQPRRVQSEFLYPEVFENQQSKKSRTSNDFSHGLYFNKNLISQRGSFAYQLNTLPKTTNSIFAMTQTRHLQYSQNQYDLIISKDENRIRSWFSTLTFTITILFLLGLILSLLALLLYGTNNTISSAFLPNSSKYLSTRIQTSLTIILLLGLVMSVYFIISAIRSNYNQNLEALLLSKVKSISTRLQNKVDLSSKLNNDEQRTLILNEESSTYNVDINLYNNDGLLLSSTKPHLTEEQILSPQMNPKAFESLQNYKTSQLLIQEELEGSKYLSAYIPLFNGKNDVIGFVNTPFFSKNEQLNKQISKLVVNIVNIYFLLLLGGVFLAYIISRQISKPLLLIREKIAKTALGGQNELITYNRDDEIGQLVKQYNKMVLELEESATQLAENEREGAWREMAKQVAHEIKNPLTPMKLSVQHLQRAYDSGPSEKLDKLFGKTSKLLIDQINSLSNMASEFGNFAKMPEEAYTSFDVSETLANTVDLFKQSENVQIVATIEPNAYISADPEQIARVFNNLIKNAIQAIPDGRKGKISISLTKTDKVCITVADNGKGIPIDNYKKVFVPNFSTKNSGMGLGLAICKKIIETAHGTIRFESTADVGTTFFVDLPYNEKE